MKRTAFAIPVVVFSLVAGSALAQNRCEIELIGSGYACSVTFSGSPGSSTPLTFTFSAPTSPNVQTAIELDVNGLPFACSCVAKGKPGAIGSAAASTDFVCVEAHPSPTPNDEVLAGKTAAGGGKIVKGKYMSNSASIGVFACVKN